MSAAGEELPDELKDAWNTLSRGGDARKIRRHLPDIQRSVSMIRGLETSLKAAFVNTRPEAANTAARADVRTALVSTLQSHSLSIGGVLKEFSRLSADAQGAVQKMMGWIAGHLVSLLTAFAAHLGLQNWSVATQVASFPPGASFTITLTFS